MLVCSSALTQSIPRTGHRPDLLCPFQKYRFVVLQQSETKQALYTTTALRWRKKTQQETWSRSPSKRPHHKARSGDENPDPATLICMSRKHFLFSSVIHYVTVYQRNTRKPIFSADNLNGIWEWTFSNQNLAKRKKCSRGQVLSLHNFLVSQKYRINTEGNTLSRH